ncbi:hypothetical protein [Halomicrococcus sp. NG-SE-24]|uniref:hypothetical protein n=1 Tax=Halomicrococcus sp. NG-SE-24 TaxID=3436928 RepID=UPI003D9A078B
MVVFVATAAMLGGVGGAREKSPLEQTTHVIQNTVELSLLDTVHGFLERVDRPLKTVVDLVKTIQQLFGDGGAGSD